MKKNYKVIITSVIGFGIIILNGYFVFELLVTNYFIILIIGLSIIGLSLFLWHRDIKRSYVILDTMDSQKSFEKEHGSSPLKNGKFSKAYKSWLVRKKGKIDQYRIQSYDRKGSFRLAKKQFNPFGFEETIDYFFFLVFCYFVPIIIGLIFMAVIYWYIIFPVLGFITSSLLISRYRDYKSLYKYLDSEVKRDLYEIETGYNPLKDDKFTFKYKDWMIRYEIQI